MSDVETELVYFSAVVHVEITGTAAHRKMMKAELADQTTHVVICGHVLTLELGDEE